MDITIHKSFSEVQEQVVPFLKRTGRACVFNSPSWFAYLEAAPVGKPSYYLAKDGNKVTAFASFLAVPSLLAGRPIMLSDPLRGGIVALKKSCVRHVTSLIETIAEHARSMKAVAIRMVLAADDDIGLLNVLRDHGFCLSHVNCDFVVPLAGNMEEQLMLCGISRRNEIRQSLKRGVIVRESSDWELFFDIFHPLYMETMEHNGIKPMNMASLQSMFELNHSQFIMLSASVENKPVAAMVGIKDIETRTLHYYFSVMSRDGKWHRPMEKLIYTSMARSVDLGFEQYNFMTTSTDFRSGVYSFKQQWGARPRPIIHMERNMSLLLAIRSRIARIKNGFYKQR